MKHRRSNRTLSVFLLIVVLVPLGLISPALATPATASATGTGPDDALAVSGDWASLNAGASRWYAFYYAGDGSQIEVALQVEPNDSATFVVWTPQEIQRWKLGLRVEPIGRGAADRFTVGKLVWSGNFTTAGTYYVVVERAANQVGTSYYLLDVSGSGVSFSKPSPTPTTAPVQTPAKTKAPTKLTGKLVFQTTYGGTFYTINADGTNLRRITDGIDPVWSPDGTGPARIAFTRWTDPRGVWVVNADGSGARRVFDWSEARYPSWSPDGQQIVFSRQYGRPAAGGGRGGPGGGRGRGGPGGGGPGGGSASTPWQLGIVNPGSGAFWEPLPNSEVSLTPAWSPDGNQIVYDAVHGLRLQSVDGQQSQQLTSDPKDTSPVWSPAPPGGGTGGQQVAFVRRQNDHWEIYVVNADGSNLRRLTDTPAWADGTAANSVSPAWSPDGSSIAFFTDRTGKWEIWVMAADGSGQRPMFGSQLAGLKLDYAFVAERAISWTR